MKRNIRFPPLHRLICKHAQIFSLFLFNQKQNRRFDVVEELWRALGENAEKLVGMLAGILQAANDEKQKEDSLRMMQELSYEHEDFARVLVKPHNAKVLVKMAHSGQERVQALACKTLQNVSWWKVLRLEHKMQKRKKKMISGCS